MGAGLIAKAAVDRHISLISFAVAQIAMDIEPGLGLLTGAATLHGWSHMVGGALVIAGLVTAIARPIVPWLVARWNCEVTHYRVSWLAVTEPFTWSAAAAGACFGTLSHIALDALMHADMHPFAPIHAANPLLWRVAHDTVYSMCALGALVGLVAWILRKRAGRSPRNTGV